MIKDQREELFNKISRQNIVKRDILSNLNDYKNNNLIKVTTGIRRSGKSILTYLMLNKDFAYMNFDNFYLANMEHNEIFYKIREVYGNINTIFFDEIQNINKWELLVERFFDAGYNVFLTGSNASLMDDELATRLTGRNLKINLFPFSFNEFLSSKNIKMETDTTMNRSLLFNYLDRYMINGGFPDIVVNNVNPKLFLENLYSDIIERDIIIKRKIKMESSFNEISQSLISNNSNLISYNKLKNYFNIKSVNTVKDYIKYVNESYLTFIIHPFSFKPREIESGNKKVYCIDTGLFNKISYSNSVNYGVILENLVALYLLRIKKYYFYGLYIYFYKFTDNEVDFLIMYRNKITALINVSYVSDERDINARKLKALDRASLNLNCKNIILVSYDINNEITYNGNKIKIMCVYHHPIIYHIII